MAAAGRERSKAQLDGSLRPDDRHAAEKYFVSRTLDRFDWNAELMRGDLEGGPFNSSSGSRAEGCSLGVMLPQALAAMGLIDE